MTGVYCYAIVDRHSRETLREMVKFAERADVNDFSHDNSPYLGNYVRPRLLASPDLSSESSPSRRENVEQPTRPSPTAVEEEESTLNIDEFGSNVGVGLAMADLLPVAPETIVEEPTRPHIKELEAKRRKEKEPAAEPSYFDVDLSDYEDDYSDLDGNEFDGPFPDEAGTSGSHEVEVPQRATADGTSSGAQSGSTPVSNLAVVVKSESMDFWKARELRKVEKRAQEIALKEKFDLMVAENERLKLQIHEASMSHPLSSSQARGPGIEHSVPTSTYAAEQPREPSGHGYL